MEDQEELDLPEYPEDSLAGALILEQKGILEAELAQDEVPPEPDQEPHRKKLKRELRREALLRMEEAARTVKDFEAVTKMWDLLESNEVRRVANHEVGRGDIPLEWGAAKDGFFFPRQPGGAARQAQTGDFLEMIFSCPYEMHQLIEDADISIAVRDLKDDHKEILYYLIFRLYPCEKIAEIRNQSDRNIRKVRATLLKKLRKALHKALAEREKLGLSMTTTQRIFLQENKEAALDGGLE